MRTQNERGSTELDELPMDRDRSADDERTKARSIRRALQRRDCKFAFTAALACLSFLIVSLVVSLEYEDLALPSSSEMFIRTVIETLTISAALGVFAVQWLSRHLTKDGMGILIGLPFLAVGLLHLFRLIVFPETMSGTQSSLPQYLEVIAQFTFIVPVLFMTFPTGKGAARSFNRFLLLFTTLVYSVVTFLILSLIAGELPVLYDPAVGTIQPMQLSNSTVLALLLVAIIRQFGARSESIDVHHTYFTTALIIGLFGQLALMIDYGSIFFNSIGLTFWTFCFIMMFVASFRASVDRPYAQLVLAKRQVEKDQKKLMDLLEELVKKTEEVEISKLKAQTYFDFLAHDISNIISPIMPYAEILLAEERINAERRTIASRIFEQTKKAGDFIFSLRKLADAESVAPEETSMIDLKDVIPRIESSIRMKNQKRECMITYALPLTTSLNVMGGEHIENVLCDILESYTQYNLTDLISMHMDVRELKEEGSPPYWQIRIDCHGQLLPDEIRSCLNEIFDPNKRYCRGVGTNFSFYSSIVSHFGGRMWIENVTDGGMMTGSRIVIDLPKGSCG